MLTKKQRDLLALIHDRMSTSDVAPSFEEMKQALGLKSKSGIHRLISALVERGYLERLPHRARALQIKRLPDNLKPAGARPLTKGNSAAKRTGVLADPVLFEVPLYGKIAAGTPIEAVRHEISTLPIPSDMAGRRDTYALTVEGDSMIKAGIHTGDTVIIERCDTAENGAIIVALVDGEEVTLKRLRRAGNKIVLEPENDDYEPQILEPSRVEIQGRLIGLLRKYH